MSVRNQVSESLELADMMKSLQSQSPSPPPLLDSDIQFGSLEDSIETQLKVLEIKEARLNSRVKELELREKEMNLVRERLELRERMLESKEKWFEDFDPAKAGKESIVLSEIVSGQNLLMILNEQVDGIEKLCDRVYHVLEMSDDPAKWVLDVVKEFYLENEERGVLESVWKRSCVIVLEQLMRLRPNVVPPVKEEAARLASEWRMKIKAEDDQKGTLEVWGFLLLLGAYGLVDEFAASEVLSMLACIGKKQRKADELRREFGLADKEQGSTVPNSEEKIDSPLKEDVQLDNQMASVSTSPWPKLETFCESNDGIGLKFFSNEHVEEQGSTSNSSTYPWPELKTFCVCMDGRSLRLFLCDHVEEHDSMCNEVREALLLAPDPEKLVLDAIAGFLRLQPEFDNSLSLSKVRKSCILLLEQLITICPQISATVKEEASKMADEWRANLGEKYQNPVIVYGFLHFVAAYGFTSNYKSDELLVLLATANRYKVCPGLCPILGLVDKVAVLIENLKQKNLLHEAIEHIYAFEVADKFKPVSLLKDYLTCSKKKIYKKGNKSLTQLDQAHAIGKEIVVLRTVRSCIAKYNLESEYPPQELEKEISELENCYFVKLEVLIENLKQKNLLHEAIEHISAFEVADKYKLVSLLKDYLTYSKKKICKKGNKSLPQLDQAHAIGKEIVVLRMVKSCITKYNLESEYPLQELEKDISELENCYFVKLEVLIKNLKQKNLLREDKFKLVSLLKDYLTYSKKKLYEKGDKSLTQLDQVHAIGKEIIVLRTVRSCVTYFNLKSEYPLQELEKDISELENRYSFKLEVIENPKQMNLLHEDKFKLVSRLKDYLTCSKKKIYEKGNKSLTQLDQAHAIGKEILVWRTVRSCVTKYNLKSEYPLKKLDKDISALENRYLVELEVLIENPKQKNLLHEDKFKLVSLLKDYLTCSKKKIYEKRNKSLTQLDQAHAIGKEIVVLRTVRSCIAKYNLESEYPPLELEKDISEKENCYFVKLEGSMV